MKGELHEREQEEILSYIEAIGFTDQRLQAEMADHLFITTGTHMSRGMRSNKQGMNSSKKTF